MSAGLSHNQRNTCGHRPDVDVGFSEGPLPPGPPGEGGRRTGEGLHPALRAVLLPRGEGLASVVFYLERVWS